MTRYLVDQNRTRKRADLDPRSGDPGYPYIGAYKGNLGIPGVTPKWP